MGFLIGALFWLFLVVVVLSLLVHGIRTATGLNGTQAMARFYWGLLLVVVWVGVAAVYFLAISLAFWPMIEHLLGKGPKSGGLAPAIVIGTFGALAMGTPVVATKAATYVNRLKVRGRRRGNAS